MSITADDLYMHSRQGAFFNECFEKVSDHHDYKMWQEAGANIPLVTFASKEEKESYVKISKTSNKYRVN